MFPSHDRAWLTDYDSSVTDQTPGTVPLRYSPMPTEDDYNVGEFQRYFAKKTNQNIYIEISEKDFNDLSSQNSRLLWQLYEPISLPWQISGDKDQV